jgi:DNA-binding MarR family transcriptional regulator
MSTERFDRYVVVAQRFGARTVLFQEAAARRLGFSATQLECFQLVRHEGPLTASELARETGLTQASLSVIIDKLVDKKFLSREQDRADRRRWIMIANPAAIALVDGVYVAHASRTAALLDDYSEEEFDASLRFMDRLAKELKLTAVELAQSRPVGSD